MKCINKWICLSLLIAVSCVSGCGKTSAAIEQPYDVYATAADFGLSSNGTAEAKSYFASNLCVSEDVAIGTDSTDSQVAEGAGTFNLETNTVVYAKNLYERLYPASTTKILTAYIALKYCDGQRECRQSGIRFFRLQFKSRRRDPASGFTIRSDAAQRERRRSCHCGIHIGRCRFVCGSDESGGGSNGGDKVPFCQSERPSG